MSHSILSELHQDHSNIERLLKVLDVELSKIQEGGGIDMTTIMDVIDYIENYPVLVHNPKEDMLYNAYNARTPEGAEIVGSLLEQHNQLPALTKVFRQLLGEVSIGALIISRNGLIRKARDYIDAQRAHIKIEETLMFPMILDTFDVNDWEGLKSQLPIQGDQFFNAEIERYNKLLDHLTK